MPRHAALLQEVGRAEDRKPQLDSTVRIELNCNMIWCVRDRFG